MWKYQDELDTPFPFNNFSLVKETISLTQNEISGKYRYKPQSMEEQRDLRTACLWESG